MNLLDPPDAVALCWLETSTNSRIVLFVVVLRSDVLSGLLGKACWTCHSDSDLYDYSAPSLGRL